MNPKPKLTEKMIQSAVRVLLERGNYAYTTLRESLTIPQRVLPRADKVIK